MYESIGDIPKALAVSVSPEDESVYRGHSQVSVSVTCVCPLNDVFIVKINFDL